MPFVITAFLTVVFVCLVAAGMWGCPQYNVWQQDLAGQAALARAQQDRQIKVAEAKAKLDAASDLAKAEVVRAEGVAKAQHIINSTLTERYIQWLQAEALADKECKVIYVPTEAGLPILEAKR